MNQMQDKPMTKNLRIRRARAAFFVLCSVMLLAAASPATPRRLAAVEGAARQNPAPADTTLAREAVVDLIEDELLPSLEEIIPDESARATIAAGWEAKIDDLAGRTRKQVVEALFAVVTAVVSDKAETDRLWADWNSNEGDEEAENVEAADADMEGARKSADVRLDQTVAYIQNLEGLKDRNFEYGGRLLELRINRLSSADQKSLGEAISLGDSVEAVSSDKNEETQRRQAIRSVLLLNLVDGKQPLTLAKELVARFAKTSLADLKNEIKSRLPLTDNSPARASWDPKNFTDPREYKHDGDFRFIVWGLMNQPPRLGLRFDAILRDPSVVKTLLLSTSVIHRNRLTTFDQYRLATYYPYGLILKVPTENIVSTNNEDQAFKNYSRFENVTPLQMTDMRLEVRRVASQFEIRTPMDILKATRGKGGESGYNEIVVMGTSPEGKEVEVVGIFVKVKSPSGVPYVRQQDSRSGTPFVTEEVRRLIDDLAKRKGLPVCMIVDSTGA